MPLKQVARQLNLHLNTVYQHVKTGAIPAFRIGRAWRVWPQDLDNLSEPSQSVQRFALLKEKKCPSESEAGVSILRTSPSQAAKELDTVLERLTGKPRRNTTTRCE
jgi:excisionase family DNA binding protein